MAALTTAIYLAVIVHEGNNPAAPVLMWTAVMLAGGGMAAAAALLSNPKSARLTALAATVVLGALGAISIFSVGMGFLVAAGLALAAVSAIGQRRADG